MKKQPLVSIITPCYNGESFIHRYFASILSQTYNNIELIFINDGSTDRTEEIALSYREKLEDKGIEFIYIHQENAGQAAAINRAIKIFKGDYLTWPDSDDWMSNDCIEKKVSYLESHPEYSIVMCRTGKVLEGDLTKCVSYYGRENKNKHNIFEDLISTTDVYFAPGGYMVRSESFLKAVPSKEIYCGNTGQNMQMLLPVAYEFECGFIDDELYYYLVRENSHSRSSKTPKQVYENLYGNESTVIQTLHKIDMPMDKREWYIQFAKYSWAKRRFYLAIEFRDRDNICNFYKEIKKYGKLTIKLRVQYLVFKSKLFHFLYDLIKNDKNKRSN